MKTVDRLMRKALEDGVFPGGVLLVSKEDQIVFFEDYGYADIFSGTRMTRETIFDLASITKTLATTPAVMRLVQQNKLNIETRIGEILSEFTSDEKGNIRIRELLTHTSGLIDWRPYYPDVYSHPPEERKAALRSLLLKEALTDLPGKKMLYSDLGFMILEWIVESLSRKTLDNFVREEIYDPLGLDNLFFTDTSREKAGSGNFAATENCPWRKMVLQGLVHDDNAYSVGGVCGHAGLFGTAEAVRLLVSELLNTYYGHSSKGIFRQDIVSLFFKRQENAGRALGFDCPPGKDGSCGQYFSEETIGHLGFTGTSFWADTMRFATVILLTNRVHPSRENIKIRAFRPMLHDAVMKALGYA